MSLAGRMAVMHKGRILQVDVPQRVYSEPVNTYVATFVGYPPMNLFSDCVVGGALQRLGARGLALDLADGPVLVGIRPERLQVEGHGEISLNGRVRTVEHLGAEQILEIETAVSRCSVRTATLREYPPDASIELHCNQADLHFFSPHADKPRIEGRGK
jgi:ABC-type sugar transport system ATPase subunit